MDTTSPVMSPLISTAAADQVAKAASTAHDAVDKAAATADNAASAVRPFIARTAQTAHQTVDKVTGVVAPATDWLAKQSEALAATGRDAEADARSYISAHPWQSVGAALGIGYLLGRLAGLR